MENEILKWETKAKIDFLSLMLEIIPKTNLLYWKYQIELEEATTALRELMTCKNEVKKVEK